VEETKKAWDEVGKRFSELGRRLSDRYRTAEETEREDAGDALDRFVAEMDRTFTSLGETLRDPTASEDIRNVVASLGDAVETTFSDVGGAIRRRLRPSS
jgi:hypothetical protein